MSLENYEQKSKIPTSDDIASESHKDIDTGISILISILIFEILCVLIVLAFAVY